MRSFAILIVSLSLSFFNNAAHGAIDETVEVGVARVDITPREPMRLGGYESRKTESVGIETRLSARALAISSDRDGVAIVVTADTLAIPAAIADEVAARIKKQKNIPRERIAFCASHTHTRLRFGSRAQPVRHDDPGRSACQTRSLFAGIDR